jgi:hypothetical protein
MNSASSVVDLVPHSQQLRMLSAGFISFYFAGGFAYDLRFVLRKSLRQVGINEKSVH